MDKNVLVTGSGGFIGRRAVPALRAAGWRVIQCGRGDDFVGSGDFVRLDLNSPDQIILLAETISCSAIVHLAARIGWSDETDSDLFVPNVLSTGRVAKLASVCGAKLIFVSASMVHGARCENISLDTPLNPDTAYGRSKVLGEQLVAASGATHCVLRLAGVFGYNGPSHLGLNRAIIGACQGVPPTQVGPGRAQRNYIYVEDVAQAIVYALEHDLTGTHLLAGREILSISQMLQVLCDRFLPGQKPMIKAGAEAADQIVVSSSDLPQGKSFSEALADIQLGLTS